MSLIQLEAKYWRLVENINKTLLSQTFLALRRHIEQITSLTNNEWRGIHERLNLMTIALRNSFDPGHFNYSFLRNQIRRVNVNIIPQYAITREIFRVMFEKPNYPSHFSVPAPVNRLSRDDFENLAERIRNVLLKFQAGKPINGVDPGFVTKGRSFCIMGMIS